MYLDIPQGSKINIQGLECSIPQEGYVYNLQTKKVEFRGVHSRSDIKEEQFWERIPLPNWYKIKMKEWENYDKKKKDDDPAYYDAQLEEYKKIEWDRRLNGFWFMNNGTAVYLTGSHYVYMAWWLIDVGYPKFRMPDLEYFYALQYCIEDPDCMGMIEVTKRRFGKTYRAGLFLYEYITRTRNTNGGIQSKTGQDAKKMFGKAVINPFKKLPRFFRPEYDMSLGVTPKTEIRFQQTNVRGKKAEDTLDKEELGSMIDHQSADTVAYDGQKLHRYVADESGKCFGRGTKIRMYDGSVRFVENITEGELVMGDDSTPRITYGVTNGKEEMFNIVPKKGVAWECNASHVLSLKWCATKNNPKRGWIGKQIVNITISDFLKLANWEKKHLMLYKNSVEYTEQLHELDPYFLGLWLGDGSKFNPEITTADPEIVDYLKELAIKEGLEFSNPEHIQYRLFCRRSNRLKGTVGGVDYNFESCVKASEHFGYKGDFIKSKVYNENEWVKEDNKKNRLLTAMQNYNIICNKHIPNEFLIDSRKNRLELLAGLVDSDGHISKGPSGKPKNIEITQKIKILAYQINELALSLGFYSSIIPKIATMRRNDKSLYECQVYKVMIYGDLWQIPTKVRRKKIPKIDFHVNRRTSAHCGFSVNPIGVGEYFGFAVDGNHLFLLEDGTVVHNTTEVNIYDRHEVIRYCMLDDEGRIIGKALYTTTVEKMETDRDGIQDAFKKLWDDSNQLKREENGRTSSGLYRFFMTSDRARNFDIYGIPDIEKTVKEILADRKTVEHNQRSLIARIRKEARTIEEAFSIDSEKCAFNSIKIEKQIRFLEENPVFLRTVTFARRVEDQKIHWFDDKKALWRIWKFPPVGEEHKYEFKLSIRVPGRADKGIISIDGYTNTQGGRYGSKAGAYIICKNENGIYEPVGEFYGRPLEKSTLHEQIMLASEFYGVKSLWEHVADEYRDYYRDRGKIGYLMRYPLSSIDPVKRGKENYERHFGYPTTPYALTKALDEGVSYVENYCHYIMFIDLLRQMLSFDPADRTKSDLVVAFINGLVACNEPIYTPAPPKTPLIRIIPNTGVGNYN